MIEVPDFPSREAMARFLSTRIHDDEDVRLLELQFDLLLERQARLQEPFVEIHLGEKVAQRDLKTTADRRRNGEIFGRVANKNPENAGLYPGLCTSGHVSSALIGAVNEGTLFAEPGTITLVAVSLSESSAFDNRHTAPVTRRHASRGSPADHILAAT